MIKYLKLLLTPKILCSFYQFCKNHYYEIWRQYSKAGKRELLFSNYKVPHCTLVIMETHFVRGRYWKSAVSRAPHRAQAEIMEDAGRFVHWSLCAHAEHLSVGSLARKKRVPRDVRRLCMCSFIPHWVAPIVWRQWERGPRQGAAPHSNFTAFCASHCACVRQVNFLCQRRAWIIKKKVHAPPW